MAEAVGVHLEPDRRRIGDEAPSAVARLDARGRLCDLAIVHRDEELLEAVAGARALVVDAPLEVPDAGGRRDVERVLAWCDVPAFPVSRRRLEAVHGGMRGVELAGALAAAGTAPRETLPDLVLRELRWERDHPPGSPPLDLADYRELWLGVRAPGHRPRGRRPPRPAAIGQAWELLAGVVDMGGWIPDATGDDRSLRADAARLDAICCAHVAGRALAGRDVLLLGEEGSGRLALPADANLTARVAATLVRLRASGEIRIRR